MGPRRQWRTQVCACACAVLAIAAPALAQPTEPDGPVPTARYERPPQGVDPSILDRPPPAPEREPEPVASPRQAERSTIFVPEAPVVRRRGVIAPASIETPTTMPTERPWERMTVGAPPPTPVELPGMRTTSLPAIPPKAVRAPPAPGRTVELQIGAFADRGNAERAARTARAAGPTRIQSTAVGGATYHRVIVGPGNEAPLRAALARLGFRDARPVRGS